MLSAEFICRLAGHKRSKRTARRAGETWRSQCIYCHSPMLRISAKNWAIIPARPEQHPH